ncbi:hypothetical protein ABZT45_32105 [Streptomyces sp. NPDC005356]|uniref:hypothetical protein n=1 Tax=Streptomyces sp. NPDC005356 TaxID=3157167 RepID=UPI0033AA7A32
MRHRYRYSALLCSAVALVAIPLTASPAAAAEASSSCGVTHPVLGPIVITGEALGGWNWASANALTSVHLEAKDTKADGAHPAVRLVTQRRGEDIHYWSWHHNTKGSDTTDSWDTSASDTAGITTAWIQGGLFDGSTRLSLCTGAKKVNPD